MAFHESVGFWGENAWRLLGRIKLVGILRLRRIGRERPILLRSR